MQEYLEVKQVVNKIVQAKVLSMEMESSGESTDEEGSGQSCIWINDDEEDFMEQNMLDAQKMPASLSSPGLPSQSELIILVKEHKMNWLSFVEHLKLTVDNLSDNLS